MHIPTVYSQIPLLALKNLKRCSHIAAAANPVLEANLHMRQLRWNVLQNSNHIPVSAWLDQLKAAPPSRLALPSQQQQAHSVFAAQLASAAIALAAQLPPEIGGMDQSLLQLWQGRIAHLPPSADALREISNALGPSHPWLSGW